MIYVTEFLGGYRIRRSPARWSTEKRNFAVLSLRKEGETEFYFEGRTLTVKKGQVLYLPPHLEYEQRVVQKEELTVLHLNTDRLLFDAPTLLPAPEGDGFEAAVNAFEKGDLYASVAAVYALLGEWMQPSSPCGPERAFRYMNAHFGESDTTVARLAEIADLSETRFRTLFRERFGTTPLKKLQQLRMERARQLLSTGYYPVREIAARCGYDNPKNFTAAFRACYGCAPTNYAKEQKNR